MPTSRIASDGESSTLPNFSGGFAAGADTGSGCTDWPAAAPVTARSHPTHTYAIRAFITCGYRRERTANAEAGMRNRTGCHTSNRVQLAPPAPETTQNEGMESEFT